MSGPSEVDPVHPPTNVEHPCIPLEHRGSGYSRLLSNSDALANLADNHRERYAAGSPWPHVVLDGLVDEALVAEAEIREIIPGLALERLRSHRQMKLQSPDVAGEAARMLLHDLSSEPFVAFVESLTGVRGLKTDPSRLWAGINIGPPGAFQALHRDFRKHPDNGMFQRVTALLYLNSDWRVEYGGALELWSSDMRTCGQRILPSAGRLVIFETSPRALHAVDSVRCPPERARLALITRYYSEVPGPGDRREAILRRPRRPEDPWLVGVAGLSDGVVELRRRSGKFVKQIRGLLSRDGGVPKSRPPKS
jgi:hypothetical protein